MGLAVASFHRSGSSALMQHLSRSGLHPGHDLMVGDIYNPDGYFEDWGPVHFHDAVLRAAGLDWTSVTREAIPISPAHASYIVEYCAKREAETPSWGFKDPRVCQFLQHWLDLDPALKAVIMYRSPVDCSWSLYRRSARELAIGAEEDVNGRICRQPDHALSLWITHNRKLLDVARRFPDRTVVISHAGFAAGFNAAEALRDLFGLDLDPADVSQTFRPDRFKQTGTPLPVCNPDLGMEATDVWNQLQDMDLAKSARNETQELQFQHDSTGLILQNDLLAKVVSYARDHARAMETELKTTREILGLVDQASERARLLERRLTASRTVARKLKRWPLAMFFSRSRKYSPLIDEILASE